MFQSRMKCSRSTGMIYMWLRRPSYSSFSRSFGHHGLHSTLPRSKRFFGDDYGPLCDPYLNTAEEIKCLRRLLCSLLESTHPGLTNVAKYYFLHPSKQLRPLLVLLFSYATNGLGRDWATCKNRSMALHLSEPQSHLHNVTFVSDVNHLKSTMSGLSNHMQALFNGPEHPSSPGPGQALTSLLLPTQKSLALIVEMIHVASLMHDDVVDNANFRRGMPSSPSVFGSKSAVLAGDFLLGRASTALTRLGSLEVTSLISGAITSLVEGELLQLHPSSGWDSQDYMRPLFFRDLWDVYLKRLYLKTASLMANAASAAVILGGAEPDDIWNNIAFDYGLNLGMAFQLTDDVLDYEGDAYVLGKCGGVDLLQGLITAPALFAWEQYPDLGSLLGTGLATGAGLEDARNIVQQSCGLSKTRELAAQYASVARQTLDPLPDSDAKSCLQSLTDRITERRN